MSGLSGGARFNTTLSGIESTWGGAGWVEVNYGQGGNVSDYTVHGQCQDRTEPSSCHDDLSNSLAGRISNFQANCTCATEQHFSLRWDELNRLVEGRRFDRVGGSVGSGTGAWTYAARMRYRYDGANQRTVKESFEASGINTASRVALSVFPGDFERRGLVRNTTTYDAVTTGVDATETQYMVAGARIVWDPATSATSPNFDRNRRITYALTDLLQTSSAVVDLASGELLELSTYYPNGARENLWASDSNVPLEPMGFTGKEADEEIGLTYFGERWLMPRLGRWASPDPLHVHAAGGGEALNSYHYVSGNLLQARDPLGLSRDDEVREALRAVQTATDQHGPAYQGTPPSGTLLHHRVDTTLRGQISRGEISAGAGRRLVTEAVIDPDGNILAHGAEGGGPAVLRLREDRALIAQLRSSGQGDWVETINGRPQVRAGYFRTLDALVITAPEDMVDAVRTGRVSARGAVFAIDVKSSRSAQLIGTRDIQNRLGTRQVACRPGGSVIDSLERVSRALGVAVRGVGFLADVMQFLSSFFLAANVAGDVFQLAEIPERAMATSDEIRTQIFQGVERTVETIEENDREAGVRQTHRGVCRSGSCD